METSFLIMYGNRHHEPVNRKLRRIGIYFYTDLLLYVNLHALCELFKQ